MKSISDMNLAEVTLAILSAAVNIPDGMYARAQYLATEELRALLDNQAAQHQGDPVAWLNIGTGHVTTSEVVVMDWDDEKEQVQALYAEHPAPVAGQAQCEECKGWGYHENHHEGGGTECGECGGSGNAAVAVVMPEHTMRSVMDAIQQARGLPVLTSNQCHALAESLNYVARLNGVKP